jgi:hypothetical protein
MKRYCLSIAVLCFLASSVCAAEGKKKVRLFILSGQSNMAGLNPKISFTPAIEKAFADDEVIVVKSASGGMPIRCWYKEWKPAGGEKPKDNGRLYKRLMDRVKAATKDKTLTSVTFVWMQGERDANEKHGEVYAESLKGLIKQLRDDLKREDMGVVIGRISDFDMKNKRYPHWTMVREAQVKVAEEDPLCEWVDTDDLNGGKNDLHYNKQGYKTLGERFAEKAIGLVTGKKAEKKPEKPEKSEKAEKPEKPKAGAAE